MKQTSKAIFISLLAILILELSGYSQVLYNLKLEKAGYLKSDKLILSDSTSIILSRSRPLFSFLLNDRLHFSGEVEAILTTDLYTQNFGSISVTFGSSGHYSSGWKGELAFENKGNDTVTISNVVPFGEDSASVYITGRGPSDLARAYLFRPGFQPVRVILPDNAWELGYSSFFTGNGYSVCSVIRRTKIIDGLKKRYATVLPPKAKVYYSLNAEVFRVNGKTGSVRCLETDICLILKHLIIHYIKEMIWPG